MTTTVNLGLTLPTVGGDTDAWGTELNTNLTIIDTNCFSPNNPVVSSAITINGDLSFNQSYNLTNLKSLRLYNQASTLSSGSDVKCLYVSGSELYWNTSSGTAVKLTSGTGINAAGIATNVYTVQAVSGNIAIGASDTFDLLLTSTAAARSITLPLANAVAAGRRYKVKDITGSAQTNNITIIRSGSDSIEGIAGNKTLATNFGAWELVSDGSSAWYLL